ncbi:MAG TPA: flagellar biosynthetic protein FliR [Tepidisphaeraceae bacterium]|jgi:flagellar biosynthetic protein FliR
MDLDALLQYVPAFVLVFFRLAGMMVFAPLLGSTRIPRRLKVLLGLILAMAITGGIAKPVAMPQTSWGLALGIGGEIIFGVAMGMVMNFVFIAAQWAGEMIGQQMGLNMSEVLDPQFGAQGSLIGDLYFMLTLVIFISPPVNGHHAMLRGIRASFDALPLLSVGMNAGIFDMVLGMFTAGTILAIQLAAPMLVTMLCVDLALGFIGKTIPQINIMTAGMSVKSIIGILVLIVGLLVTGNVLSGALEDSMHKAQSAWSTPAASAEH